MGERSYTDYAVKISKELVLDYYKVVSMTLSEINELYKEKFNNVISERMKDEKNLEIIKYCFKHYDIFYDFFGKDFIRSLCKEDLTNYFESKRFYVNGYDAIMTEKQKEVLITSNGYKYSLRSYCNMNEVVKECFVTKFPYLIKYNMTISSYDMDRSIDKIILSFDVPYLDKKKERETKQFTCSLLSFMKDDIYGILESYLDNIDFGNSCEYVDTFYNEINDFLNSREFQIFWEEIKRTRENL